MSSLRVWSVAMGLLLPGAAWAEPLVYERFESETAGSRQGGVTFGNDVVGYGGLAVPNQRAASFDGQAGTALVYNKHVASADFTVEAFIKPASRPTFAAIATDWDEENDQRAWALVLTSNGELRFDVSPDGQFYMANKLESPPGLICAGTWYHVAAVSQGATSRLYINGREVVTATRGKPGLFQSPTGNLKIGNSGRYGTAGPRPFHGGMDEVRITEQALAPTEFIQTKEPLPAAKGPVPEKYELPFAAKTPAEAQAWQEQARKRLLQLVERQLPRCDTQRVPLDFQVGESEDRGDYTLCKGSFRANATDGTRRSCLLAVPKGKGPFPAMLCLHGHGGIAEQVFDAKTIYHRFADQFARGGYVVLAPSFPHRDFAAMTLWDLFRAVDVLQSRPEVDPQRLGVGGLSMGGEWTMWIAACDPRLKVAIVSGWMCTTAGVFSVPNCPCWELPGFVDLMDVCEVNLLIAPRAVLFESAELDGCFPIRHCRDGFARIRAGYQVFGAAAADVQQDTWVAGHEWHGKQAYPLVDRVLGGHAAR